VKRRPLLPLVLLLVAGGLVTLLLGCKQGEGDRCQVNEDCEDGLTCNQATNPPRCQRSEGNNPIDAALPIDAIDAAIDAPLDDAPPDA
jgi:hypothetical protein